MVRLVAVKSKERELFWNINQKYLYEMTLYYPDVMDENGNYHYGYFEKYFSDPKRKAFFIYDDEIMVGFVMLNPYSNIAGHTPDNTVAEFTIFPTYRRKHYATEAAELILTTYKGRWEIKYNEANYAAKKFWHKVVAPYNPEIYRLNDKETVLVFETGEGYPCA